MKKRSVLLFFLLLTVLPCAADPVDALRATEVARAFFQNDHNVALRLAPLQRVERVSAPLTKAGEEQVPFYIFNRGGGGFVLVAADDACNPILGYSFTHSFGQGDDMPDGLAAWLDDLEEQVALAREFLQRLGAQPRRQGLSGRGFKHRHLFHRGLLMVMGLLYPGRE